ncbi:MAG: NnrU family protein [Candidatus Binatia bacterium]|nr:NnrU family protein [Candidatus Binatia bacterium]
MSPPLQIVGWWLAFAGTHTALSHPPIRARLVARFGEQGFRGVYSLVALATFIPLVTTFFLHRTSRGVWLPALAMVPGIWWLTMGVNLAALFLIVLGFSLPNPVSTLSRQSAAQPHGVLRVTRHPAFMGFALLDFGHLLVLRSPIDLAFFGGLCAYSVLGAAHQDWRRRKTTPELARFYQETSFIPLVALWQGRTRFAANEIRWGAVVFALVLYGVLFFSHHRIFG